MERHHNGNNRHRSALIQNAIRSYVRGMSREVSFYRTNVTLQCTARNTLKTSNTAHQMRMLNTYNKMFSHGMRYHQTKRRQTFPPAAISKTSRLPGVIPMIECRRSQQCRQLPRPADSNLQVSTAYRATYASLPVPSQQCYRE